MSMKAMAGSLRGDQNRSQEGFSSTDEHVLDLCAKYLQKL